MNTPVSRTIFALWLFLFGLVTISIPDDLTNNSSPALEEYVQSSDVSESKVKAAMTDVIVGYSTVSHAVESIFHHSRRPHSLLPSSSGDLYQLFSIYRL